MAQKTAPEVSIRPETSCFRGLRWHLALPLKQGPLIKLGKVMLDHGYHLFAESLFPAVVSLEDAVGHQVLFVPKSGRIQIRVHYSVEADKRKPVAREIAEQIVGLANNGGLIDSVSS